MLATYLSGRLELIEILRRDGVSVTFEVQDEFNRIGEIQTGKSCFVIFCTRKNTGRDRQAILILWRGY
jgi:hypothetical protein